MADPIDFEHPEPVPSASQLCALPFVSAVSGYLADFLGLSHVRATLHRVMSRDRLAYLQQLCAYAASADALDHTNAGRMFASTDGIIGKAFRERAVVRTREFPDEQAWWTAYREDRAGIGETGEGSGHVLSHLAVPMLDKSGGNAICVLFVEAGKLNVFATADHLRAVVGMCHGFCRTLDGLARRPLPRVRNYPLPVGCPFTSKETVYTRLQEVLCEPEPPRFKLLTSLNFAPTS